AQVDPIDTARAFDRAVVHREDHAVTLAQRRYLSTRLHSRALLVEDELAAREILSRFPQQDGNLTRKDERAIDVLMQAVIVAFAILQEKRRRAALARFMAACDEGRMLFRVARWLAQSVVPAIGDPGQRRIEGLAQGRDQWWQGIGEIFVFAASEA